jgi:Ca2+-binding RTX toxin-like protein
MARNLYGTDNSEILHGTSGHWPDGDAIWGYGGDDEIYAGDGWDYLTGGFGADYLDGGSAFDQAIYKDSPVGVTVFLSPGLGFGGTAEGDVLVNIENLAGSEFDDVLIGDDYRNELYGRAGQDTLKGGGGYDRLAGDAGNDSGDYMHGGSGFDTASYESSSSGVVVSLITDSAAYGDAQGDTLDSIENLTGSRYTDNLIGDDGSNVLNGLGGDDTLKGYGGADSLAGDIGNDILFGQDGSDTLRGDAGADTTNGGRGDDYHPAPRSDASPPGGSTACDHDHTGSTNGFSAGPVALAMPMSLQVVSWSQCKQALQVNITRTLQLILQPNWLARAGTR